MSSSGRSLFSILKMTACILKIGEAMSKLRIYFHLLTATNFTAAIWYNMKVIVVPNEPIFRTYHAYGGSWKYLTIWATIIQSVFFWICFINDLYGSNDINPKPKPFIRKFKDHLFCCIAFPVSAFVALTFWGLYAIDRELIFPVAMDSYFPSWLNHVMHTNILIFTLVEFITAFRLYPNRREGLITLTSFMFVYLIWVFIIYSKSGYWVYPVMEVLNWPMRILFFLTLLMFVLGIYISQEALNRQIWGKEMNKLGGKKESQKKVK